ncbi:unnamed protein product [Rotaria socialis]|uniref:Uncharacterized protein n=1 Tax=Rotaria socialis TaxID=392032 RepID=A0A820GVP9_9BILA|nr:unnamed protein product [Rotaria socialis]CAF4302430.1 unnamed protein product [Rotaria socialis]
MTHCTKLISNEKSVATVVTRCIINSKQTADEYSTDVDWMTEKKERSISILRNEKKKKVCIIGAGTAVGGVATTEKVELMSGLHCDINDGVQGGSSSYRNSTLLHRQVDFDPSPVQMRTSFGQNSHA